MLVCIRGDDFYCDLISLVFIVFHGLFYMFCIIIDTSDSDCDSILLLYVYMVFGGFLFIFDFYYWLFMIMLVLCVMILGCFWIICFNYIESISGSRLLCVSMWVYVCVCVLCIFGFYGRIICIIFWCVLFGIIFVLLDYIMLVMFDVIIRCYYCCDDSILSLYIYMVFGGLLISASFIGMIFISIRLNPIYYETSIKCCILLNIIFMSYFLFVNELLVL